MISDAEVFKLKSKVLQDIVKRYEELLKKNRLEEKHADEILERVKNSIATSKNERDFSDEIQKFCLDFPEFKQIEHKLNLKRTEIIQQIGQECLENLMETRWEEWEKLTNKLDESKEENIKKWISKLPKEVRENFLNKYIPELQNYAF